MKPIAYGGPARQPDGEHERVIVSAGTPEQAQGCLRAAGYSMDKTLWESAWSPVRDPLEKVVLGGAPVGAVFALVGWTGGGQASPFRRRRPIEWRSGLKLTAAAVLKRVADALSTELECVSEELPTVEAALDYIDLWAVYDTEYAEGIMSAVDEGDSPLPAISFAKHHGMKRLAHTFGIAFGTRKAVR